jgi:8-oxo-dGTP pyrophosphatase MutT (NUDIX family)
MIVVESFGIIPLFNDEGTWKVLLILHRVGNHWGFPKGKAQPVETALETASRELKEETGLVVAKVLLEQPIKEQYQFRRGKQAIVKIVHYFPALVEGILHLQEEEIRDAKWLTISDAMKQLTFGEARHILGECMRHLTILPS